MIQFEKIVFVRTSIININATSRTENNMMQGTFWKSYDKKFIFKKCWKLSFWDILRFQNEWIDISLYKEKSLILKFSCINKHYVRAKITILTFRAVVLICTKKFQNWGLYFVKTDINTFIFETQYASKWSFSTFLENIRFIKTFSKTAVWSYCYLRVYGIAMSRKNSA